MSDVTTEQLVAANAAARLQDDPVLQGALDEIVREETLRAIKLADPGERERARMMVLAVERLREDLNRSIEWVLSARDRANRARSFE